MADAGGYFKDGAAYERVTGRWSRVAGEAFFDWLALPGGLRWLDVGCGNGAFTEIILNKAAPASLSGVDKAEAQIDFARKRPGADRVDYRMGDAVSLPFDDDAFDAAVMALVIGYLPDRLSALAEMKRVVRPGGTIATYVWDGPHSGHLQQPLIDALKDIGIEFSPMPGDSDRSLGALQTLFETSGLEDVTCHAIEFEQSFADFDDFWTAQNAHANRFVQAIRDLTATELEDYRRLLRDRLAPDATGRIAYTARANAARGRVAG
jgi:ubiquinone/menaquinone biosynthesis C-methylase UbiE